MYIDEETNISQETIDNIREMMKLYPHGSHVIMSTSDAKGSGAWVLTDTILLNLLRLSERALKDKLRNTDA